MQRDHTAAAFSPVVPAKNAIGYAKTINPLQCNLRPDNAKEFIPATP